MNKKRECKRIWCVLMAVIMVFASLYLEPVEATAAGQPVKIKLTYGQTEARGMIESINAFRTSDTEAWCWNEDNSEQVLCKTEELQYDYELERIAMTRAAEIALSFSHTRPNGSDCFSAYTSSYSAKGENIAAGQSSGAQVFTAWQESALPYSGQGHRRNMLNAGFKAVGIGHVVYQGCHYWVQEFGDKVVDATPSAVNDNMQVVDVDVASSYITEVKTNLVDVSLKVGEQATAVDFTLALNVKDYWGYQQECVVENTCTARIEDETIASLSDDLVITGLKEGTTKIWVSNPFGEEFYRTITVIKAAADIDQIAISTIPDQTYTGKGITPAVTVTDGTKTLTEDVDYTVLYSNNINVGTASVKVTGKGEYKGTITTGFKILPRAISEVNPINISDRTYTGRAIEPLFSIHYGEVFLRKDTDYTLTFKDNVNVGTATVTITGKGNFEGTTTVTFKIVGNPGVSVEPIADQTYTGSAITPAVVVKDGSTVLRMNVDYTVSFSRNISVGTATVKVTGKGEYEGTSIAEFKIVPCPISKVFTSKISDKTYTGKAIEPSFAIYYKNKTLRKGTDYTLSFMDNINVGTATVTITGKGNFEGTKIVTFKIVEKDPVKIATISDKIYTGKELTPTVTVKDGMKTLIKDVHYQVTYRDNINVGTATVIVTGIGEYEGTVSSTFKITARSLSYARVTAIADQTYTGNAVTPKLTVTYNGKTLTENIDYVAVYSNNVNAGNATVNIQGLGNFTGSRTVSFKIVKKDQPVQKDDTIPKDDTISKDDTVIEEEPVYEEEFEEEEDEVVHTTKIRLSKSKVTLKVGKTYRLKVYVDAGSVDKVSFKSSNKRIATVSSKGTIKAKKAGTVMITVKSGDKTKKCKVTVKRKK